MESIRAYILAVSAGAIVCSIILSLIRPTGSGKGIIGMFCGMVMAILTLRPLAGGINLNLTNYRQDLEQRVQTVVSQGNAQYKSQLAARISEQTCAYIQNKASELGLKIQVSVRVSDEEWPIPCQVILEGEASPWARSSLQTYIAGELGIEEEDQYWK